MSVVRAFKPRERGWRPYQIAAELNLTVDYVSDLFALADRYKAEAAELDDAPPDAPDADPIPWPRRLHVPHTVGRPVGFNQQYPHSSSWMRQSYLRATARLLFIHGCGCYARFNVASPVF